MEQRKLPAEGQPAASPALPPWMHRTTSYAPDRRATMLEHMARARSLPQPQTATAPQQSGKSGQDLLGDLIGHIVLFGVFALLFMSRVPLYIGAFLFLTDGERIESVLAKLGIRFEPDTIGPDIVKGFASWFGWFALLVALRDSAPTWLAPWMPPALSWPVIAGTAIAVAVVETLAARAMRRVLPWFGWESSPNGLAWTTIKLVMAIGLLVAVVQLSR
ncbi:hypothetical protein RAD16_05260 [Bradyrhizobium sp. 18BD]